MTGRRLKNEKTRKERQCPASKKQALRKEADKEIKKLNDDLAKRNAELEASNKELEAFAHSISHDLRGPLRSIDGFSRILLDDYGDKLDDTGKDYLRRVRASSLKMAELMDDLLALSRIIRKDLDIATIDLSEIGRDISRRLRESDPDRNSDFIIADGIRVSGDYNLLRIAMENLLDNAWKFTSTRRSARIEFGITKKEGETVYFVRDNGVGFDMDYVDKLFQPFQRLHAENEFSGTGIGLATIYRIIRRFGGTVRAEGEAGKGATFYFTLD